MMSGRSVASLSGLAAFFALVIIALSFLSTDDPGNSAQNDVRAPQSQLFPEALEPPCLPAAAEVKKPGRISPRAIDVRVPRSRRWSQGLIRAYESPSPVIADAYKKTFAATVVLHYPGVASCEHAAEVRLTGDYKDHIEMTEGGRADASLKIRMKTGNVSGMTRYKMLLPGTRLGENEVLMTELFRELGFIAPRTALIRGSINGAPERDFLLQEDLSKEVLEYHGQRETALVEPDESLAFASIAENPHGTVISGDMFFARTTNIAWARRTAGGAAVAQAASVTLSRAVSERWGKAGSAGVSQLSDSLLSGRNVDIRAELAAYRALAVATLSDHALVTANRRFFFDAVAQGLRPIYYDSLVPVADLRAPSRSLAKGSGRFGQDLPPLLRGLRRSDIRSARARLLAVRVDDWLARVRAAGINTLYGGAPLDVTVLRKVKRSILANLRAIHSFLPEPEQRQGELQWVPRPHEEAGLRFDVVFGSSASGYVACTNRGGDCERLQLSQRSYFELLAGNLSDGHVPRKYGGTSAETYTSGTPPPSVNFSGGRKQLLGGGAQIISYGQAIATVDEPRKRVILRHTREADRTLIQGGVLRDWQIYLRPSPSAKPRLDLDRFNDRLLTGCLTLADMRVERISLDVRGGLCEDGLNLLRVEGDIADVHARDTNQDAVDMDFSDVTIGALSVSRAGNDCIDLSAGLYRFGVVKLTDCTDKAVSVGEGASAAFARTHVTRADVGIAAKDSSKITLSSAQVRGAGICATAYRKKQEFGGAVIVAPKLECGDGDVRVQQGSTLRDSP